ncbi:uncharacterized protein LOC132942093 [Metopolophium dirhodum]|uniref:uncharacterized protein LOC132942093 n=1 Tax=Metopolophium dirhodum TaxID=44670 RepID=UPI00298FB240|nr:uncharacterized protein LOC132942093 [Metopolophium dirhodum]
MDGRQWNSITFKVLNTFSDSEDSDTSAQNSVIVFVRDDMNNIDDSLAVIEDLETDIVNNEDCITQINLFDMAFEVETDPNVGMLSDKMVNIDDSLTIIEEIETDDGSSTENVVKVKRKLKYEEGDELEWLKNKNKILRMQGKDYKGLKKNEKGKFSFTESRSARELGKICDSTFFII